MLPEVLKLLVDVRDASSDIQAFTSGMDLSQYRQDILYSLPLAHAEHPFDLGVPYSYLAMKKSHDPRETLAFLAKDPNLDLAIIFGSTAAGRARPHSDIDIAVYPRQPLDHSALQDLSDRIALATGRPVDLVDLSRSEGALLRQILRTGKVLFAKRPGILGTLHERLLVWQEDFEPALKAMLSARLKRFTRPLHGS